MPSDSCTAALSTSLIGVPYSTSAKIGTRTFTRTRPDTYHASSKRIPSLDRPQRLNILELLVVLDIRLSPAQESTHILWSIPVRGTLAPNRRRPIHSSVERKHQAARR